MTGLDRELWTDYGPGVRLAHSPLQTLKIVAERLEKAGHEDAAHTIIVSVQHIEVEERKRRFARTRY